MSSFVNYIHLSSNFSPGQQRNQSMNTTTAHQAPKLVCSSPLFRWPHTHISFFFFNFTHPSSRSKSGTDITQNTTQPQTVQSSIWLCCAGSGKCRLETLASSKEEEWAQRSGEVTSLLLPTYQFLFHFQTCSLKWHHLRQLSRLHTSPSEATKSFILFFSHMQLCPPRSVNRLWCAKSVESTFKTTSYIFAGDSEESF